MKGFRAGLVFIAIILPLMLVVLLSQIYRLTYVPMLDDTQHHIDIVIKKHGSAKQFAGVLQEKHLISSATLFVLLMKIQGLSQSLQAGVYRIQAQETAQHFLKRVVAGDVLNFQLSIIEGSTLFQLKEKLSHAPYLTHSADVFEQFKSDHLNAEGLFLADSYQYTANSDSLHLLSRAHQSLNDYLLEQWKQRDADLPYQSPYQMLIAASILEKESAIASERKIISGVIVNRLKRRMPLQMDPTVIYGLGETFTAPLKREDLSKDTAYNTYMHYGLPPTPIAMLGKLSIEAAAHPEKTEYLYFVARGDGSHQFSKTYAQQRKAVEKARKGEF